jgi:hypothetical protein
MPDEQIKFHIIHARSSIDVIPDARSRRLFASAPNPFE